MNRSYLLAVVFLLGLLQLGCVAWRYTTTPVVTGRVIDADTHKPVVGAEVGFRTHETVSTRTKEGGSFTLASDHKWGPAFGIPFEFTLCGGVLYIAAPGYLTFERNLGERVYHEVYLPDVMLSKKTPIQSLETTRGTGR